MCGRCGKGRNKGVATFPMASIARSKNKRTPPSRNKPPKDHQHSDTVSFVGQLSNAPLLVGGVSAYLPPEQKATPISKEKRKY